MRYGVPQVLEHAEVQVISSVHGLPEALRDSLAAAASQQANFLRGFTQPHRASRRSSNESDAGKAGAVPPGDGAAAQSGTDGFGRVVEEYSQLSVSLPALYVRLLADTCMHMPTHRLNDTHPPARVSQVHLPPSFAVHPGHGRGAASAAGTHPTQQPAQAATARGHGGRVQ